MLSPLEAAPLTSGPTAEGSVSGADEARVVDGVGKQHPVGEVAPGRYTLRVRFGDEELDQGAVTLEPREVQRWTCRASLRNCIRN